MPLTRRAFLSAAAAAPLAAAADTATPTKPTQALPFDLKQVRLLESPLRSAMERNRRYLGELEADRLLHTFRITAGLPSAAKPLGGWEKPDCELRGHFAGHYLSACALMSRAAGDSEIRARGNLIVAELAKCQKAAGNGYLSAFPIELFDRLRDGKKVWAPWYTIHKIMAGLLDMHTLAGNGQALAVLEGIAAWTKNWMAQFNDAQLAQVLKVEYGGMNHVLYNLSAVTGKEEYAALAHRFDDASLFDPLAEGRDQLKGLHMNTQIPKILGAARRYELTGEERYRRIAEFFWQQVTGPRAYCTGGGSNHELWRTEPGKLASELSQETQECCCTHNMLKLTRSLFQWQQLPRYAEYYERALFNGILGTMDDQSAMTMYYVPLAAGYWKLYSTPRDSFWCCTGTGTESFSKLADSIYFHGENELFVNLFIASELNWREKGLRVRQETTFPEREGTTLSFDAWQPVQTAVSIRIPQWAAKAAVTVNDKRTPVRAGEYVRIERVWKSGDRVEIALPMSLRVESMPDDAGLQAFLYGPLVLAGGLGSEGLTKELQYTEAHEISGKPAGAPDFVAASKEPSAWIKPVAGQPLTFRTADQKRDITMVPLNRLFGQRYGVYWRVKPRG